MHQHQQGLTAPLYVEVSPLLRKPLTGVGRFVARLLEALIPLTPLRLIATRSREDPHGTDLGVPLPWGEEIAIDALSRGPAAGDLTTWVRRLLSLPRRRSNAEQAARSPGLCTWLRPRRRLFRREIGIFYDFTPLLLPWTHREETCADFRSFFAEAALSFDRVVALSHSTKADARWLCALPEENIVVGYPGPSLCVHGHADSHPTGRREDALLVVSTREPRKNGPFLIDWFFRTKGLPAEATLWWVGPSGWLCELGRRKVLSWQGRTVEFLGEVSDERLCRLYRQATLSVYSSLYEGFGFPVLDALRHGTPILCSGNSSLQEFGDLGAYLFDPCDPASLEDTYCQLRDELRSGMWRSPDLALLDRRFSWDALARMILSLCA